MRHDQIPIYFQPYSPTYMFAEKQMIYMSLKFLNVILKPVQYQFQTGRTQILITISYNLDFSFSKVEC